MTMVQRKRAAKLQQTMYLYSRYGRAWLLMLLVAVLQITIITIASIAGLNDGECMIAPASAMFTFVQFLVCMFPVGVDNEINEKITQDAYHGSVMPAKFMCSLPFEARDLLNFKIIMWEKAAAVNVLFVTIGHIISLIAESRGYMVYRGASGLFTLMAIITEIICIIAFLKKSTKLNIILGAFIGFSFSFACGIMDELSGMSPDAMSSSSLKIFSGVSGIIIYIAATLIIAAAGELYIKRKKNVSWNMFK
ncbi:MAG: hypothetical protein K2K34_03795 [Oscillospiraceae bacterium]|nr:hypothetical protein [Oscillospiraceae bacterium]